MIKIPAFYFNPQELGAIANEYRPVYLLSSPFPHVAIDHFLPGDILELLIQEFPTVDQIDWTLWGPGAIKHTDNKDVQKIGTSEETKFGPFTRHFIAQFNSATFIHFLESLTGVGDIITDPTYNGCGLHSTGRGGRLMIHSDANRHPVPERIHQRLNLILFLNENWKEEYGGHFELWDKTATQCEKTVAPIANRLIIFDTGQYSFHGHPHPLACPKNRRRNSIAVYYYVLDRPNGEDYSGLQKGITWIPLPNQEKEATDWAWLTKQTVKKITPPFVIDAARFLRRKIKNKGL